MQTDLPPGATPLDPDEAEGLLQPHVGTRRELDELEEANIQIGLEWATTVVDRKRVDVLTEKFLYELHERMFGEVWSWAGDVRRTNKNIGVDRFAIRIEVRNLIEDARAWRDRNTYEPDELAVRLHHRLVSIHPFANGNGRHARMMADLIIRQLGRPSFSWGRGRPTNTTELRAGYIAALRSADSGDIEPLLEFARS